MTDKQVIIDGVDVSQCKCYNPNIKMDCLLYPLQSDACKNNPNCYYKQLKRKESQLKRKELECEELTKNYLTVIQQRNAAEHQLDQLKVENKELRNKITEIFACLIKSNRVGVITDTLWVDDIMTLWDYIAQTLGMEGDQTQIEEQILQLISEAENEKV